VTSDFQRERRESSITSALTSIGTSTALAAGIAEGPLLLPGHVVGVSFAVIDEQTAEPGEQISEELQAMSWSSVVLPVLGTAGEVQIGDVHIGLALHAGTGMFSRTRVLTLSPRFMFVNYTPLVLEVCTSWRSSFARIPLLKSRSTQRFSPVLDGDAIAQDEQHADSAQENPRQSLGAMSERPDRAGQASHHHAARSDKHLFTVGPNEAVSLYRFGQLDDKKAGVLLRVRDRGGLHSRNALQIRIRYQALDSSEMVVPPRRLRMRVYWQGECVHDGLWPGLGRRHSRGSVELTLALCTESLPHGDLQVVLFRGFRTFHSIRLHGDALAATFEEEQQFVVPLEQLRVVIAASIVETSSSQWSGPYYVDEVVAFTARLPDQAGW
jgi:hypothetical protein